jgi:DNA-binding GntR family transcriptional regulator
MPSSEDKSPDTAKTQGQVAYESLRAIILSGAIKPGERLGERDLARRVNVSRTPLREALGRLERDGLAVSKVGLGYFALDYEPAEIEKLYEFREILEMNSCRLAAERISQDGIAELRDIIKQLAVYEAIKSATVDQIRNEVHLGLRIHEVIARESGNNFIHDALLQVYDRLRLLTWIDVLSWDRWSDTRKEHKDLVDAVVNKDGKRAARIVQRHMQRCVHDALLIIRAQYKEPGRNDRSRDIRNQR